MSESGESGNNAEVLRRILAGLRDGRTPPRGVVPGSWPGGRRGILGGLPAPPPWAGRSVVEDGGVTHELVSLERPQVRVDRLTAGAAFSCPTELSVSVFDRPTGYRWVRLPPTIQVEGGCYTLAEAVRLIRAVEELIAAVG